VPVNKQFMTPDEGHENRWTSTPVPNTSSYGVAANQYNEVTFDPVKTTELKIEIQFQPGRCGSLIRWRVE
jgi:hypothetical protein